jgi:hypothetical protein
MPRPKAGSDDVVGDRRMDAVANSSASAPAVSDRVGVAAPLSVNLEGSVRSRGRTCPEDGSGECDLIEAGLNEAAGGLALWG